MSVQTRPTWTKIGPSPAEIARTWDSMAACDASCWCFRFRVKPSCAVQSGRRFCARRRSRRQARGHAWANIVSTRLDALLRSSVTRHPRQCSAARVCVLTGLLRSKSARIVGRLFPAWRRGLTVGRVSVCSGVLGRPKSRSWRRASISQTWHASVRNGPGWGVRRYMGLFRLDVSKLRPGIGPA